MTAYSSQKTLLLISTSDNLSTNLKFNNKLNKYDTDNIINKGVNIHIIKKLKYVNIYVAIFTKIYVLLNTKYLTKKMCIFINF